MQLERHLPVGGGEARLTVAGTKGLPKAGRGPDPEMEQAPVKSEPEVIADPRGTAVNQSLVQPSPGPSGRTEPNPALRWRTFNAEGWAIARTTENTGFTCAQCRAAVDSSERRLPQPLPALPLVAARRHQARRPRFACRGDAGHRRRLPRSEGVRRRASLLEVWCGTAEQGGPRRHRCADRAHAGGLVTRSGTWRPSPPGPRGALFQQRPRVLRCDRGGRGAEVGVRDRVSPCRSPGDGDLTHDTVLADRHFRVEQRSRVLRLVVGNVPPRQHADVLSFLEAGLPGDRPGRHGASVDARAVGEPSGRRPAMARVNRRRVAPPTSSRTAARYSAGVVPLSGSIELAAHLSPSRRRPGRRACRRPSHFPSVRPRLGDRHIGAVPADGLSSPELAVVRDSNDYGARSLCGRCRDPRGLLDRGTGILDPGPPPGEPNARTATHRCGNGSDGGGAEQTATRTGTSPSEVHPVRGSTADATCPPTPRSRSDCGARARSEACQTCSCLTSSGSATVSECASTRRPATPRTPSESGGAHDAGGLVPSPSGSRPLWRSRSGRALPTRRAAGSRGHELGARRAPGARGRALPAVPRRNHRFQRHRSWSALRRRFARRCCEHASGSGVQPDARCIARRQLVETPPGRETPPLRRPARRSASASASRSTRRCRSRTT